MVPFIKRGETVEVGGQGQVRMVKIWTITGTISI
jgi:hypothetical protein